MASKITLCSAPIGDYTVVVPACKSLLWSEYPAKLAECVRAADGTELNVTTDATVAGKKLVIGDVAGLDGGVSVEAGHYKIAAVGGNVYVNGAPTVGGYDYITQDEAIAAAFAALIAAIEGGETALGEADVAVKRHPGAYQLKFGDEFETYDRSIWHNFAGNPPVRYAMTASSKEDPTVCNQADAEGCYVKDSILHVPAIYDPETGNFCNHQPVTEGTVNTRYGVVEMMAKSGDYPATIALWGIGEGLELDMSENMSCGNSTTLSTVHNWNDNDHFITGRIVIDGGFDEKYHLYSMRWTSEKVEFAMDGEIYHVQDMKEFDPTDLVKNSRVFWLMGVTLASTVGFGNPYGQNKATYDELIRDGKLHSTDLLVDFIRVYQDDAIPGTYNSLTPHEEDPATRALHRSLDTTKRVEGVPVT